MEWKTHTVPTGSTYQFKVGDIVQVRIKGGESIYNSADGKVHSIPGSEGIIAQGAILDTAATSIDLVAPVVAPDDTGDINYRPTVVLTLNPVGLAPKNFTNTIAEALVDPSNITVMRQENTSAKLKTVVTKERLAYFHNKLKAVLAAKGDVKTVNYGREDYTADANGVVTLPDNIAEVEGTNDTVSVIGKQYVGDDYWKWELQYDFSDANSLKIKRGSAIVGNTIDYYTERVLPTAAYVQSLADATTNIKLQKVNALPDPATAQDGIIYLVPNSGAGDNVYDEYFRVNKGTDADPDYAFELFGTTAVDLANYLQETDLLEITTAEIDEMFAPAAP